jgi:hypothetical protein
MQGRAGRSQRVAEQLGRANDSADRVCQLEARVAE